MIRMNVLSSHAVNEINIFLLDLSSEHEIAKWRSLLANYPTVCPDFR
jgi:hypothetical protein